MKRKLLFRLTSALLLFIILAIPVFTYGDVLFQPLPFEDSVNGRNSYVFNSAVGHPTIPEQQQFIDSIKDGAMSASARYGIPASVIIGMGLEESGAGFTRIGYYANNLFAIKVWGLYPSGGWQLKGQPDENDGTVPIVANYGPDRLVFDEAARQDNWYKAFPDRNAAIDFLAGTYLLSKRYSPARDNYKSHIAAGWSVQDAAKQYCYDIAAAGYNYLGGDYYRNKIGAIMDSFNLYQYDTATDVQPPTVNSIDVSPIASDGTDIVSGNITVSADVSDNTGVAKVMFYSAGGTNLIGTSNSAPYSINLNTIGLNNGEQYIQVVAYDSAGNQATGMRRIYVSNSNPLTVNSFDVSPIASDGSTIWGTVTLSAAVSNASKVQFYSNNGSYLLGTSYTEPYTVSWYTKGYVSDGEQTLKVVASNSAGAVTSATKKVYVSNNNLPALGAITVSPINSDNYTVSGSVSIGVTATNAARVEFYSGSNLIGASTSAPYSVSLDTKPLANGQQALKAIAYNSLGMSVSTTKTVYVSNDKTPPTVSSVNFFPINSDGYTVSGDVTITANVTDNIGVTKVEFYGGDGTSLFSTSTSAPYSYTWSTKFAANGEQTIRVIAYDAAGNQTISTKKVNVSNSSLLNLTGIDLNPVGSDGTSIWGNVTISALVNGASKVDFYSNNGGYLLGSKSAAPYAVTWYTKGYVPDGDQTLKVIAYDSAGGQAVVSRKVSVANNNAPSIGSFAVSPISSTGTVAGTVNLSTTATNTVRVEFYSGSNLIGATTSAPYSVSLDTKTLANGQQALKAIAYNSLGMSVSTTKTVYVSNDKTPPTVSSVNFFPINSDGYTVSGDVTITANVTDNVGVTKVEFYGGDGTSLFSTSTSAPYSYTWSTKLAANGEQTIRVIAYDAAGNQTISTKKVNVSNSSLLNLTGIDLNPVGSDGTSIWGNVTISALVNGASKVDFYSNNGGYLLGSKSAAPYAVTWYTKGYVPDGDQTLKVIAYDSAGGQAVVSRKVSVANSNAPSIGSFAVSPISSTGTVAGTVSLSATATNAVRVEFYSGSNLIGASTSAPYSVSLDTKTLANGQQALKAIAYNSLGMSVSTTKTVYVSNVSTSMSPTIGQIAISPIASDSYTVTGTVNLSVSADDPNGSSDIDRVEFYSAGGSYLIGKDLASPYSINWYTKGFVPNGQQTIKAIVFDKAGNKAATQRTINITN